jgi:hypothetical protein
MKSKPDAIRTGQEPAQAAELEEKIRQRAYELYEQRGMIDGYASDDWLQAEAEVLGTKKRKTAA